MADKHKEQVVTFETEDEASVPSHRKTPLLQYRENPAIQLQEYMSNISSPRCQSK